jgi:hypothetical protein
MIPLEPSAWVKTNFPFKFAPDYYFEKNQIRVVSDDDLGGYAHRLKKPIDLSENFKLNIIWEVKRFPKVLPELPFNKKQDDYPLRVGLILGGGAAANIPDAVKKKLPFKQHISNIVYYGPVTEKVSKKEIYCGDSPHNDYAVYCAVPSPLNKLEVSFSPLEDLKATKKVTYKPKLLGLWLFADTDDSESKSEIILHKIEFKY